MDEIRYSQWRGAPEDAGPQLLDLCHRVFDSFDDSYLLNRLPKLDAPSLWLADAGGEWVGFKLGYRRGETLFYSWLGGVDPRFRKRGIAGALMRHQHQQAVSAGYTHVETRTRAANNAMIVANLRHGFHIAGFESDPRGIPVVTQRKALA